VLFRVKNFEGAATPTRQFATWFTAPISLFPPETEAQKDQAMAELSGAFKADFEKFATAWRVQKYAPPPGTAAK
jgi:hypothetical protein